MITLMDHVDKKRNKVRITKSLIARFKLEFDRYNDKRYHLARGKKNGKYIWKMKMWRRARQIEYFKRLRAKKKNANI